RPRHRGGRGRRSIFAPIMRVAGHIGWLQRRSAFDRSDPATHRRTLRLANGGTIVPTMSASTPSSPRVLLVTAGVGAGHNAVGQALEEGIREKWPHVCVRTVDALDLEPIVFGPLMRQGNVLGMTRLPRLYGAIYRAADRNHPGPPA